MMLLLKIFVENIQYLVFLLIHFVDYLQSWKFFHNSGDALKTDSFIQLTILKFYFESFFIVAYISCNGWSSWCSREGDISSLERDFSSLKCEHCTFWFCKID